MRSRKKYYGATLVTVAAALGFLGVAPASASEATQLCNAQHTGEELCPGGKATTSLHLINNGTLTLLSDLGDVLCLHVLATVSLLALASKGVRQEIHTTELLFAKCGLNATHGNCLITVLEIPLFSLLKTGLNLGKVTAKGGLFHLQCLVGGIIMTLCDLGPNEAYEAQIEGALHTQESAHGMIPFTEAPALLNKGGFLCPNESSLDGLLEPLHHVWIAS